MQLDSLVVQHVMHAKHKSCCCSRCLDTTLHGAGGVSRAMRCKREARYACEEVVEQQKGGAHGRHLGAE